MTGLFPNPYMVTIAKLEKQNAEFLEALKRTEQTMRNLAANLDGDLEVIARNEAMNLRDDIAKAGGE